MWLPDDTTPPCATFTRTPHGWAIACAGWPTLTADDAPSTVALVEAMAAFMEEQGVRVTRKVQP